MAIPLPARYILGMVESPDPTPSPSPPPSSADWARATMWMVIVLILAAGGLFVFKSCRDAPGDVADKASQVIGKVGHALADVASAFNRGTVTTSFVSYATTVSNHHYLQFATLKQMEIFTRTEVPSTAFGYLPLPDVVVEARAPVEYTYYLDLNAAWRFVLEDRTVYAFAPSIRFNKPAVDASALTYEVRKGYFKTAEAQEKLKQSITSLVTLRAKENIPLVKESGRKQTADFVEKWLVKTFADGSNYHVKVFFPDEPPPNRLVLPAQEKESPR